MVSPGRWSVLTTACMALVLPGAAAAQPTDAAAAASGEPRGDDAVRAEAQALFDRGLEAFDAGRIEEACGLFERSFDVRPSPAPMINLGYCRKEVGDPEGALLAFRRYVELMGDALADAEWAEIATVVRELGGTIERPQPVVGPPPPPPPSPPPPPPVDEPAGVEPLWFWTTAGLAAALGIGAGVTGGLAYSDNQDFRQSGDAGLRESGQTLQLSTNVLAGVAGAAAVAALVLAFFTDWGDESSPAEPPALGLAPGGLVWRW